MFDRVLKAKRDWHNMLNYAEREAFAKGFVKGYTKGLAEDLAKKKLKNNFSI